MKEGVKKGVKEGVREGGSEGGREGGSEGGSEGGREGGVVVYSCMLCNLCMVLLRMCALVFVSVSDSHVGMTVIDLSESIAIDPR